MLFSCTEETLLTQSPSSVELTETIFSSDYSLLNNNDAEEQHLNHSMLLVARSITQTTSDLPEQFLSALREVNPAHLHSGMKLIDFINHAPEFRDRFNENLKIQFNSSPLSLTDHLDANNLLASINGSLSYRDANYQLAIHSYKELGSAEKSTSSSFLFAVGETLGEDEALVYQDLSSGSFLLSEKEASELESSLIFIDFGTDYDLENAWTILHRLDDSYNTKINLPTSSDKMNGETIVLKDWRIRRRMENDKRTEYRAWAIAHPRDISDRASFEGNEYAENQRRRDIGNLTPANCVLIDWDNVEYSFLNVPIGEAGGPLDRFFVFAYERDWINSQKGIVNECALPTSVNFHSAVTRRKHSEDVYYKECGIYEGVFNTDGIERDFATFEDEVWELKREDN